MGKRRVAWAVASVVCASLLVRCSPPDERPPPAAADGGARDGGSGGTGDAGPGDLDGGAPDGGNDGGSSDGGSFDGGTTDGGPADGGSPDAGSGGLDGGSPDGGGGGDESDGGVGGEEQPAGVTRTSFDGEVMQVEVDGSSNAYLVLRYLGEPAYQGQPLPNDGREGVFQWALVKQDPAGAVSWVRGLPSGGCVSQCEEGADLRSYRIAAWPDGHLALGVTAQQAIITPVGSFDGAGENTTDTLAVVARLSPSGEWLWAKAMRAEHGLGIVDLDVAGLYLAVSGTFGGGSEALGSPGNPERFETAGFVARFGVDGTLQASHEKWGIKGFGRGVAVAADGRVWTQMDLLTETDRRFGIYFAQLAADGSLVWERFVSDGDLVPQELARAADGSLVSVARANEAGSLTWGGRTLTFESAGHSVLLALSPDGSDRWAVALGANNTCLSVNGDGNDRVTFVGKSRGPSELNGGGDDAMVVTQFRTSDGAELWRGSIAANDSRQCSSDVAQLPGGDALVAGTWEDLLRAHPAR